MTRTRTECPEDNLRELIWDSNPNHGLPRDKKKKTFPSKSSNTTWRSLVCSHNEGLREYQEQQASCCIGLSLPKGRETGMWQPELEGKGLLQSWPQRQHHPTNWAGSQLLTMSSWDPGQLTSARSITAWDQLPRGDTWPIWDCALTAHLRNQAARTWEVNKIHSSPGTVHSPSTRSHISCWDLGRAQNAQPTRVCASVKKPRTWAA